MSTVQRIARNTTVLLLSNIASFVIGFFFTMYVARYLGAEGFGVLSFALAFTAIFGVFTDIGLQTLMIREIARDKVLAQKYLGNIAVLKIFLSIITFGLIALTINLMDYPFDTIKVIYLIGSSVVFSAFSTMFYGVFRAYERMEFEALGQILTSTLILAGAFWAINHDYGVAGFAWIYFIVSVITVGYTFVVSSWRFTMPRLEIDWGFCKEALKQAWPFGLAAVFASINYWISSVMLSYMKNDEVVGWYNAAYRLIFLLQFIPIVYIGSVFPVMSRAYTSSLDTFRFVYERSFKYLLILGIPIGAGTTILAQRIILLIFGLDYYPGIVVLQILIWSSVLQFAASSFVLLFGSMNKQIIMTWVFGICAVLNVVLNLFLIPRYGINGASVATLATQFLFLFLAFAGGLRIGYGISTRQLINNIVKILVATAVISVIVMYLKNFYILGLIPLAALLYFALLRLIGGIDKEDLSLLRSILGRQ